MHSGHSGATPFLGKWNRRLLVVDDEPETLKGYLQFLNPHSSAPARASSRKTTDASDASGSEFEILSASSGEQAIEIAKSQLAKGEPIAGGFFDVKLGSGIDGLETIRSIKALDPRLRCVVVTAYQDRSVDDIQKLFGDTYKDHWDYLNKPFTQGEIIQKGRQMTAAWNRTEESEALHAHIVRSERLAGIGQMARSIGHEFGNILLRIMGKADLALQEKETAKTHEHLEIIKKASDRAAVIVRSMQSFSKSAHSEQVSVPEDLTQAVQDAVSLINHELVKHSITLKKEWKPLPPVALDRGALAQVFLNLMINATHSMPKGGTLTVRSFEKPDAVGCEVIDTGGGIAPENLKRIFEFGFTTKGEKGSGLGLALSKQIVEAHGGALTVASQVGPKDHGTTFTVSIPISKTS